MRSGGVVGGRRALPGRLRRRLAWWWHSLEVGERLGLPAGGDVGFRADIQGLRGVAVLLVALNHAGVLVLGGGYVGVDVFFVISGFLITGWLLRRSARTGSVPFAGFYAARARRILPAASLTLAVTI